MRIGKKSPLKYPVDSRIKQGHLKWGTHGTFYGIFVAAITVVPFLFLLGMYTHTKTIEFSESSKC